jgi:hypothetical protein
MSLIIRKVIKILGTLFLAFFFVVGVWICIASIRFNRDTNHSFQDAVKSKNELVIVYKPTCKRCLRTLPKLFMKHCFGKGNEIVLNGRKLTDEQRDELENRITPTFRYKDISYNTSNYKEIEHIWKISH